MSTQRSSEAAKLLKVKLSDIPLLLIHGTTAFELRGAICFHRGKSGLRTSVGHYTAYTKRRSGRQWELFDDMKKKPVPVKDTTKIMCEFLIYTI